MSENSLTSNASLKEWDDDMSMAVELSSVDSMAVNDMRECGIQDSMYREETMMNTNGNVYSGNNGGTFLGIAQGLPGGRYPINSHPGNRSKANSAENVFGPPQSSPLLNAHNLQQSRLPVAPSQFPSQFPPYVNQQIAADNRHIEEADDDDDEDDHLENGDDEESVANSLLVEVINFVLIASSFLFDVKETVYFFFSCGIFRLLLWQKTALISVTGTPNMILKIIIIKPVKKRNITLSVVD
jgi:hypothetical protein